MSYGRQVAALLPMLGVAPKQETAHPLTQPPKAHAQPQTATH